jgi:membrane associated rhomboid family serine protease
VNEALNQTGQTFKKYIPHVTVICCLASLVLFIGINLEANLENWGVFKKWGAPSAFDIFDGDYWGLITSNFLHTEVWHIGFNLYWLWIFGKKIEFESNKIFYILLILSSALVSSLAQLAFSESTGIGLSGVGYALFGYLFVKSRTAEAYRNYLDKRTINLFLIWLVVCIILTQMDAWNVGNAAHIGGLVWGGIIGYISKYDRKIQWLIGLAYFAVLTALIFYSPFSTSYLSYKAYKLHKNQKVDEAIIAYKEILEIDPDSEFAKENLEQLEIQKLEEKAFEFHRGQKYSEARELYKQILRVDEDNEWTKENLGKLPPE